ncbi:MAG: NADH-quinone oxidoreductase subunit L [Bacteroidia bacterium]
MPGVLLAAGAVPLLLLLGFVVLAAWGRRMGGGGWLALLLSGGAAVVGVGIFILAMDDSSLLPVAAKWTWLNLGGPSIELGLNLDFGSSIMLAVVTFISFLVHLFSLAYIAEDPMRHRYWAYLALFSAAMCGLVLSSNLLMMFICWELVGVSSWFLIGFWFREKAPAFASQKAFIVNRIADAGFVVALALIWAYKGNFDFSDGDFRFYGPNWVELVVGFGLIMGAIGKSAQFPFQIWLPDAMAGPTPVSSLIHAATMVAAGVYLLIRVSPMFGWYHHAALIVIGAGTALMAAISALTQTDIKRVLAYSTVSQLGYMVMGIGLEAGANSFLHLIAHAFFKCGLFLAAGAVIHSIHKAQEASHAHFDAQDMRFMGGLWRRMPLVFIAWLFFAASLTGLPFFSGFLTKDGILEAAWNFRERLDGWGVIVTAFALLTSVLTGFYIARQGIQVFLGKNRAQGAGAGPEFLQKLPRLDWRMAVPLVVLALGSTFLVISPKSPMHLPRFPFERYIANPDWLPLVFVGCSVLGILAAAVIYRKGPLPSRGSALLWDLSFRNFFVDDIFHRWIARPVLKLAHGFQLLDKYVVDGMVHVVAGLVLRRGHRPSISTAAEWTDQHVVNPAVDGLIQPQEKHSMSRAATWLDQRFIDRMVNGLAGGLMRLGKRVGKLQSGKLQLYILYTLLGLLVLILAMVYIFTR